MIEFEEEFYFEMEKYLDNVDDFSRRKVGCPVRSVQWSGGLLVVAVLLLIAGILLVAFNRTDYEQQNDQMQRAPGYLGQENYPTDGPNGYYVFGVILMIVASLVGILFAFVIVSTVKKRKTKGKVTNHSIEGDKFEQENLKRKDDLEQGKIDQDMDIDDDQQGIDEVDQEDHQNDAQKEDNHKGDHQAQDKSAQKSSSTNCLESDL